MTNNGINWRNCSRRAIILLRSGRIQILLLADADGSSRWTDEEIADDLDTTVNTVVVVRQSFVKVGLDATIQRRKSKRQYRKLDGKEEAKLIAIACSEAPDGQARWTLKMLADQLIVLKVVKSIHPSTIYRTLKKTN